MLVLLRSPKGKTWVEAINELRHPGGASRYPNERLGAPKAKVEISILVLKNKKKVCFKPLLWFHWESVSHRGKLGPMAIIKGVSGD